VEAPSRLERVYGWLRTQPFEADALLAAALAVGLLLPPLAVGVPAGWSVLGLGLLVPLAWRRTRPTASGAAVALVAFLQLGTASSVMPADVAVLVCVYSLAAYAPRWASRAGLVTAVLGGVLAGRVYYSVPLTLIPLQAGFMALLMLLTWALGTLRRLRFREEQRLAERARLLEVERDQEARLAATAERARIAREMHDVVAHSLSVTISQADGGRYAAAEDPAAAVVALETIAATGRRALADMRALLGVLRTDDGGSTAPQPRADDIPQLVRDVAAGGLDVELRSTGTPRPLAAGPGLAAYRIVQESLTNVLKHAGPGCRARVLLTWGPDGVAIDVQDDGRGAGAVPGPPGGHGLPGMQERAGLYGGRFAAGPRTGGGFGVRAWLPYGRPV
jgi:signal transduction histidine kinase